jgi:ATP-dependent helicase HrpA
VRVDATPRRAPLPMSRLSDLRLAIDGARSRDRGRLLGRWRRLSKPGQSPAPADIDRLATDIEASRAAVAIRIARLPTIRVDESLPIAARADEIVTLIRAHQVIVLAGETGSGKTTQLPKLCLAAGRGTQGLIGCTQPRRIAARTVARRVASELGTTVGDLVGFQVRFTEQVGEASLVKFMTDGILLAETQSDAWLSQYDTIILDEAHERSLNIDFLLGYLKRLLAKRPDLKLIVTSATIDTARFSAHFDNAPVVEVEGRAYPVEVRWRGPLEKRGQSQNRGQSHFSPGDEGGAGVGARKNDSDPAPRRGPAPKKDADVAFDPLSRLIEVIDEISHDDPRGDVLVFLPGEREIRDAHLALARRKYRETDVLALYARLSATEQDRVFRPESKRRIVLATNVAETSLTVPRIRYVVDTGTARVKRYSQRSQLERLHIEPISQAAADQRKGRCGRIGPGICYRLYAEDDYAQRPRYTEPEILRTSLSGVILRMMSLGLGDVSAFPFVEAPTDRAIGDGYRRLVEIGAIEETSEKRGQENRENRGQSHFSMGDDQRAADVPRKNDSAPVSDTGAHRYRLTPVGRAIANLPVDVALARMLVESRKGSVHRELLVLVSFLSTQDPRERPADARAQADAAHAVFANPASDFLGILNLWAAYDAAHAELTQSKLRDWCQQHFLSFLRMREWRELHRQLRVMEDDPEVKQNRGQSHFSSNDHARDGAGARKNDSDPVPANPRVADPRHEAIHRCLLSGWPTQVGRKDERGQYRGTRERKFAVFPGSALAKSPPQWLLAGQILDIGKVYAMQCARIEPMWIEQQAAHLVRRSWSDAHWSRKRGTVVAFEQVTLFGLVLVERRAVQFGRHDPEQAHAIFVREALARGDLDARADFIRANARTLADAEEIEAKQRRSGLLRSDDERAAFFAGKLPVAIHSSAALDAWYRQAPASEQAALRWSLADLLAGGTGSAASDFPAHLEVAGHRLRLAYRFVPGDAADGVTVHLPLALVNVIAPTRGEWLVPGLLAEKVAEMIRGLPKALRRNFVPAPDFARAFVESLGTTPREGPLVSALAAYLTRVTGAVVTAADFAAVEVPAHLRMRYSVQEDGGRVIAEGRDLGAIQAEWAGAARLAFSQRTEADLAREDVDGFDVDEIPEAIASGAGLNAYPAFVDLGESVALRVFERRDEARDAHRGGIERLLRRALADRIKQARRQLPLANATALRWASLGSAENLRADLVEAALVERLQAHELDVRTRVAFDTLKASLGSELFPAAVARLELAEAIIEAHAELLPWFEPPLIGFAKANYDDLRVQREELLTPGFLRTTAPRQLAHFPRYLRAMRLRAERLRQDPARDQARMLGVQHYWNEYLRRRHDHRIDAAALDELRWLVEELRVSVFAQELRTPEPVSPKRLAKAVAALG